MTFRDKQSLFWSLLFPLLFLLIFGLFRFDSPQKYNVQFLDESKTPVSQQLIDNLMSLNVFFQKDFGTLDAAREQLKKGELAGIIIIPSQFGTINPKEQKEPVPFNVIIDGSNQQAQIIGTILNQFLNDYTLQTTGTPKLFTVATEGVQGHNVKYLDFIMPGILGMAIMFSSIIGIAVGITRYRERKILKRLMATPIKIRSYLISEVGNYLFLALMQITLIIGVGRFLFHVQVYGSYLWLVLITLAGTIIFLNIGFFVAGQAKTVNTAEAMSNAFTTPMMFLSGVFFSPDMLPKLVGKIVDYLPLTSLLKILRGISIDGRAPTEYPLALAILGGWIIVSFILAWKSFRLDRV
ncbi:MAG: ABC transporter permease [Patescibacteria group bacterium]|nr:ABC transporter permease [Patescibacteria group bacterium]